ncbi:UvrD-helicase domain-containing protein, partial [Vibrio sp. 10N.222.55.E8]
VATMQQWLSETEIKQAERNLQWLETERQNWAVLFAQCESSPLNLSQQYAVLMNDDHNLILAGAGSGKTSVLTARVSYLLQSHQAQAEE